MIKSVLLLSMLASSVSWAEEIETITIVGSRLPQNPDEYDYIEKIGDKVVDQGAYIRKRGSKTSTVEEKEVKKPKEEKKADGEKELLPDQDKDVIIRVLEIISETIKAFSRGFTGSVQFEKNKDGNIKMDMCVAVGGGGDCTKRKESKLTKFGDEWVVQIKTIYSIRSENKLYKVELEEETEFYWFGPYYADMWERVEAKYNVDIPDELQCNNEHDHNDYYEFGPNGNFANGHILYQCSYGILVERSRNCNSGYSLKSNLCKPSDCGSLAHGSRRQTRTTGCVNGTKQTFYDKCSFGSIAPEIVSKVCKNNTLPGPGLDPF